MLPRAELLAQPPKKVQLQKWGHDQHPGQTGDGFEILPGKCRRKNQQPNYDPDADHDSHVCGDVKLGCHGVLYGSPT
jgi:hypothetical protein